jgi:acyl dehydratase
METKATTFESKEDFLGKVGEELGVSDWVEVTQEKINMFADATGDHQWIHVDPERAAQGPFGTTVAHGLFTLSLGPVLMPGVIRTGGVKMGINYGYNKVRFTSPVKVGKRVRMRVKLADAEKVEPNGIQSTYDVTFEIEGEEKPACVAQWVTRAYW